MKKYRKSLIKRIIVMAATGIGLTVIYLLQIPERLWPMENIHFSEYLRDIQFGLILVLDIFFLYLTVRYGMILKNDEQLKRLYYAENDERQKFIREKTGGRVLEVCAAVILIAGIIAAYFNETVFFTMTGCSMFLLLTRKVLRLYYRNKY